MERIKSNASNIVIAFLLCSALVLAVLLAIPGTPPAQAAAINGFGDIALITAGPAGGDDLINVVDTRTNKLLTYQLQGNRKLVLVSARVLLVP